MVELDMEEISISNSFPMAKIKKRIKKYFLRFKSCKNKWTVIHRASVNGRICL